MEEDNFHEQFMQLPEPEKRALLKEVYDELLDVVIRGQCLEFHRAIKLGYFNEEETDREDQYRFLYQLGDDVFGGSYDKLKCSCPVCKVTVEGKGFARHLAYCMGHGRTSLRKAREGIASTYKDTVLSDEDYIEEQVSKDDGDDREWNDRKSKKRKGKNTRKNKKK